MIWQAYAWNRGLTIELINTATAVVLLRLSHAAFRMGSLGKCLSSERMTILHQQLPYSCLHGLDSSQMTIPGHSQGNSTSRETQFHPKGQNQGASWGPGQATSSLQLSLRRGFPPRQRQLCGPVSGEMWGCGLRHVITQPKVLSPGPSPTHQPPLGLEVSLHTCSNCSGICCKKREWSGLPMQQIKRRKSEWQRLSTPGRQRGEDSRSQKEAGLGEGRLPMPHSLKLGRQGGNQDRMTLAPI